MSINRDDLKTGLRELYAAHNFVPRAWTDSSDAAFIAITLIERSIALLAPELRGELLDVGCGRQPYASYFSHVTRKRTCDFDAKRGDVDFECSADRVPLPDASLDALLNTEVLEHVSDPAAVWREFHRLLRPGGKVLLSTPMYWPSHEEPHDFYRYTGFGLRRLAQEAGFEVVKLMPRGGRWAFLGQVIQHTTPQYLCFRWQRHLLNRCFLAIDAWRCNPDITLGWTILARKPPAHPQG
jgi:SAM-dependent methyltransferase